MNDPIDQALGILIPELARAKTKRDLARCSIADGKEAVTRYWAAVMASDAIERAVFALEDVREMGS